MLSVSREADWTEFNVFIWLVMLLAVLLAFLELVSGLHGASWTFLYHGPQKHGLKQG